MNDSRVDKWRRWIDDRISSEVLAMHLHRDTYRRVGEIIEENGQLPDSYYWEYLRDTYATTQAVAVRRQADRDPRVVSLGRLIDEISKDAQRISKAAFIDLWTDPERHSEAEAVFDEHFGGGIGDHLDPAIPRQDLEALESSAEGLTAFVDQHLAHSDAKAVGGLPTFNDLDAAVDQIGDLFAKYTLLLTAAGVATLVPVIQHDWEAVFRQPWMRPGYQRRGY